MASKTPAELAAVNRSKLADEWLTAAQVNRMLRTEAGDSSQLVDDQRRAGNLLGVWVASDRTYRYPPWQFDAGGTPVPQMREILRILREHGGGIDQGRRTSGWIEVEWFMTPHVDLDGQRPADHLAAHAEQVLHAAYAEFVGDADPNAW